MIIDWGNIIAAVCAPALLGILRYLWKISKSLSKIVEEWDSLLKRLDSALARLDDHDQRFNKFETLEVFCHDNRTFIEDLRGRVQKLESIQ
jgi:uncharacterized protein YoxC